MPGKVIGRTLDLGYAGTISRNPDNITISRVANENSNPIFFGQAVKINPDNSISLIEENDTCENFIGVAVRNVKQATEYFSNVGFYNPSEAVSVLTRGSMTVKCNNGAPKANSPVYVRVKQNASISNGVIGEFEAVADGTNTVLIPNIVFTTGQLDSNKITEITILSRKA